MSLELYNPLAMDISQWIRDRRAAAGLTQAQLAAKTGVTQPIVSQWERGIAEPSPIALERLRKVLGKGPRLPSPPLPSPPDPPRRERRENAPAADKLRGHMDASQYKYVVLGLIFLKDISDAFEERRAELLRDPDADPEDRDEYLGTNVFWVPEEARWSRLQEPHRPNGPAELSPGLRPAGRCPGSKGDQNPAACKVARVSTTVARRSAQALATLQAAGTRGLLTQGIGLRPQPWAPFSRPIGPVTTGPGCSGPLPPKGGGI